MMWTNVAPKSSRSIGFAAAAALLLACGGEVVADGTAEPVTPGTPGTVLVPGDAAPAVTIAFAAAAPAGSFDPLASASIQDTRILYVVADWKDLPAGAAERLDILMPGGALYASLELPIGETQRGDLQFQVLEDGTRRVTYLLQVWGTPIESYQITGPWSASVTLVGGTASASAGITLQ